VLIGSERVPEGWRPEEGLDLGEVLTTFGRANAYFAELSWNWRTASWGEPPDLAGTFFVSTVVGARVPLEEVARFIGLELTREGLARQPRGR
jgi:hypothetical protein